MPRRNRTYRISDEAFVAIWKVSARAKCSQAELIEGWAKLGAIWAKMDEAQTLAEAQKETPRPTMECLMEELKAEDKAFANLPIGRSPTAPTPSPLPVQSRNMR